MRATILPLLIGAAVLAGCATESLAVPPVGPAADTRPFPGADGCLQVYTATRTVDVDFEAYFHPHLGYEIDDASGHTVKFVPNHASDMVEQPDMVVLRPGTYRVVAESTWCGLVTVPVVIERGRTTTVHLDGQWRGPRGDARLVHLPDGETVGWIASAPSP